MLDAVREDSDDEGEELGDVSLCNRAAWVMVSARVREMKRPWARGWCFQASVGMREGSEMVVYDVTI